MSALRCVPTVPDDEPTLPGFGYELLDEFTDEHDVPTVRIVIDPLAPEEFEITEVRTTPKPRPSTPPEHLSDVIARELERLRGDGE